MSSSISVENDKQYKKTYCQHHTECLKKIQAVLDGSATEEEKEHFKQNMDECLHCIKMYQLEKCIKDVVQNKVDKHLCPQNLVATIKAKLSIV